MLGLAWGVVADEGFAALHPVVVVEYCALGSLAGVWAWAGAGLMTAGVRVELAEGLVRRVEALRRAGVARTGLRPEMVLVWQGGSAGKRLVAKIAGFEKAVVGGRGGRCVVLMGKRLRRLGCRISLSHMLAWRLRTFEKLVESLLDGGSGYRDTVKNLGRHLYSMELTGLEVMIVRGNPTVACHA